jgi:carboxyl-terminal processing protease
MMYSQTIKFEFKHLPHLMKKIYCLVLLLSALNYRTAFAQIDTVANISTEDKLYGLSKFWSEVSANFAYFDHAKVNWDSTYRAYVPKVIATKNTWEYYMLMQRFCALLKDGHTGVGFPEKLLTHKSRYKWIYIENFNKKFIITDIPVQYKDLVPLGSEVVSVNGVPAKEYAEKELIPYISSSTEHVLWNTAAAMMFYGTDSTKLFHLKLKTPQGKVIPYDYQFHTYGTKWVRRNGNTPWKMMDFKVMDGIGYVKLNTFGDEAIDSAFKSIVPQLYACKGVILDLRDNGGGSTGVGAEILKYFTDKKLLVGSAWKTRDNLSSFKAWGYYQSKDTSKKALTAWQKKALDSYKGNYWYQGDTMTFENDVKEQKITAPLIVLTGNNTASAAEDFLIILDGLKGRATTMGQRTFGSTGQPLPISLPGLTDGRICTKRDTYPDGRDFVGVGVIPDIEIPRNPSDVISGTDTVLQAALKEMGKKTK